MDLTLEAVRVGLDLKALQMQIASTNIARADVPGARLEGADFADAVASLKEAAGDPDADPARLAAITPQALQADVDSMGTAGGNAVTLDDQVAALNADGVTYRALAMGLTRRFALMQLAITGK